MKYNPFIESKLDIIETALTLVLLVLSTCGMIFSVMADDSNDTKGVPFGPHDGLALEYLSLALIGIGCALAAVLLANECFEKVCNWRFALKSVTLLNSLNSILSPNREDLEVSQLEKARTGGRKSKSGSFSLRNIRSASLAQHQQHPTSLRFSLSILAQPDDRYSPSVKVAEVGYGTFYTVAMLRFSRWCNGLPSSEQERCAALCFGKSLPSGQLALLRQVVGSDGTAAQVGRAVYIQWLRYVFNGMVAARAQPVLDRGLAL